MPVNQKSKTRIKRALAEVPDIPGVYIMKDRTGGVLYVGKAISLRRRIGSYFQDCRADTKTLVLSGKIQSFDFIPVASEAEALILENNLIKKYKPRYNTNLKDDKSYPMVKITAGRFPSVRIVRELPDGMSFYYGPFTNVELVRSVLKFIRRYYPVRNCRYDLEKKSVRLCSQYHIGRCSGPCEGKISEKEYGELVRGMSSFWSGDYKKFERKLKRELSAAVKELQFEKAQEIKDRLFMLEAMGRRFPLRDERSLVTYGESNVLENLREALRLKTIPYHIEGYDISNVSGMYSTASKVSVKGGVRDSDNYRKYRIKFTDGIDDCRMIEEVITRRFDAKEERKDMPDLILVDGGRGQLNSAVKALRKMLIDVPVISLAKRNEDIYIAGKREPLRLKGDSHELHLLQMVRDEAHRFAVSYHRTLRKKSYRGSS